MRHDAQRMTYVLLYAARMLARVRRFLVVALVGAAPLLAAPPAVAQTEGPCTATFNGVEVDRIDSLDSPLELDTTDTLLFSGIAEGGTLSAEVALIVGPITVETGTTAYATPNDEFEATISLDGVSPYGVGLFRVVGTTDDCVAEAWVRVSGRFPLATLTGLTAVGLTLGGITGQLGAIVSRRRWARSAAALGGVATGAGLAVIGQQMGRLQLSYPSVAAAAAAAALIGFVAAWQLNPAMREQRRERRREESAGSVVRTSLPVPADRAEERPQRSESDERARIPEAGTPTVATARPDDEPADEPRYRPGRREEPEPQPAADSGPYWCYVMASTDVFGLTDHTKTVATLEPGNWYLAKRTVGGWVHVVAGDDGDGWVPATSVHRQG